MKFNNEKETIQLSLKSSLITIKEKDLILVAINNIRNELEEQEIESWIRLIRVLTHEIMNSIAPITSLAETLSEIYKDEDQMKKNKLPKHIIDNTINGLNIIHQRGTGLITFVDAYRKLTKVPKPNKKEFEIRQFLGNIRILVSQKPNFNNVRFVIEMENDSMKLIADQDQLTQVMINLVKNALDALEGKRDAKIILKAFEEDGKTIIRVIDNGAGISEESMDQIFVPFFTTKEKGTGIGLSLSHHIIRIHGGNIQVKSKKEKGTTISIRI